MQEGKAVELQRRETIVAFSARQGKGSQTRFNDRFGLQEAALCAAITRGSALHACMATPLAAHVRPRQQPSASMVIRKAVLEARGRRARLRFASPGLPGLLPFLMYRGRLSPSELALATICRIPRKMTP